MTFIFHFHPSLVQLLWVRLPKQAKLAYRIRVEIYALLGTFMRVCLPKLHARLCVPKAHKRA
jgi:hypothetical protein